MSALPATCSCKNGGKPYLLQGMEVVSRDPACRVHPLTLSTVSHPTSAETIAGNWKERERGEN
jgi:hypothetical protein